LLEKIIISNRKRGSESWDSIIDVETMALFSEIEQMKQLHNCFTGFVKASYFRGCKTRE